MVMTMSEECRHWNADIVNTDLNTPKKGVVARSPSCGHLLTARIDFRHELASIHKEPDTAPEIDDDE
ncbi:hypothetical protein EA473_06155 [Natrarchaeobius chitinivorans]|uniref:Uncharacterized protein n=1 Tax=Natrarchaeobius chitinivorans TaxID=1679083 RepID=A0A3N6MG64_NATCH|nr:hypothetical protein EA473_06155 [Natrarchaeobius chitinivorans]